MVIKSWLIKHLPKMVFLNFNIAVFFSFFSFLSEAQQINSMTLQHDSYTTKYAFSCHLSLCCALV